MMATEWNGREVSEEVFEVGTSPSTINNPTILPNNRSKSGGRLDFDLMVYPHES
jgi:hypothetical protein